MSSPDNVKSESTVDKNSCGEARKNLDGRFCCPTTITLCRFQHVMSDVCDSAVLLLFGCLSHISCSYFVHS